MNDREMQKIARKEKYENELLVMQPWLPNRLAAGRSVAAGVCS